MTEFTASEHELVAELIDIGRRAVSQGLTQASGGNLSARTPDSDRFVVTGSGEWLDELTPESFTIMSLGGERVGGAERPSSEWKLHQRTYLMRPDAMSVIHAHPQYAVLLEALNKPIRFLTLDHAHYVGSAGRVPFFPNGSTELADQAAEEAKHHDAIILAHHGASTVGDSPRMAFRRAILLEEAAMTTYRALTLGDETTTFPEDERPTLAHQ